MDCHYNTSHQGTKQLGLEPQPIWSPTNPCNQHHHRTHVNICHHFFQKSSSILFLAIVLFTLSSFVASYSSSSSSSHTYYPFHCHSLQYCYQTFYHSCALQCAQCYGLVLRAIASIIASKKFAHYNCRKFIIEQWTQCVIKPTIKHISWLVIVITLIVIKGY